MFGLSRKTKEATAPADSTLPADVQIALESASVYSRPGHEDEGPRMFITWLGNSSFYWEDDRPAEAVKKAFPELNDAQVKRACRALAGLVKQHMTVPSPYAPERRPNWATNW